MPGILRCDRINLNERNTVSAVVRVLTELARNESNRADLQVSGTYYFSTPSRSISPHPGWYIICDQDHRSLYAGKAENLNSRLNSRDGSRDNFANPQRCQDPVRNFIKRFLSSGVILTLYVITIPESVFCSALGVDPPLSDLDRGNVEKVLGVFRVRFAGTL